MTKSNIEHLIEEHRKLEDAENVEFMSHFNVISSLIEPPDLSKVGHQRKVNQVNVIERNLKDLVDTNPLAKFLVLECRASLNEWYVGMNYPAPSLIADYPKLGPASAVASNSKPTTSTFGSKDDLLSVPVQSEFLLYLSEQREVIWNGMVRARKIGNTGYDYTTSSVALPTAVQLEPFVTNIENTLVSSGFTVTVERWTRQEQYTDTSDVQLRGDSAVSTVNAVYRTRQVHYAKINIGWD